MLAFASMTVGALWWSGDQKPRRRHLLQGRVDVDLMAVARRGPVGGEPVAVAAAVEQRQERQRAVDRHGDDVVIEREQVAVAGGDLGAHHRAGLRPRPRRGNAGQRRRMQADDLGGEQPEQRLLPVGGIGDVADRQTLRPACRERRQPIGENGIGDGEFVVLDLEAIGPDAHRLARREQR
ncbi:MAG: hypothetical protein DCF31_15525 [Alphaproteobacteria bacterium]|nr:MAG: hypothetical protein DCF31_15525 [Alphaproteobacteria bacterium]